jgi:serine/threonine protein kinase
MQTKVPTTLTHSTTGSRIHDVEYEVHSLIGKGGFGAAYRATRRSLSSGRWQHCCVKVIEPSKMDSWLREAYFGKVLDGVPNIIQVLDSFARDFDGAIKYVIVTELAENLNLTTYLPKRGAFSERTARRQILALARATQLLHHMHAVHCDITPNNVFVMSDGTLKLADFGIAKQIAYGRGVEIDALNPAFVATAVLQRETRLWKPREDVYQLGQLLAILLSGQPRRHSAKDVKALACSDHLKGIILRCIGPDSARYQSAREFVDALEAKAQSLSFSRPRSIDGRNLVFTGKLSIPRTKARTLARRAGAHVQASVTQDTDMIVVGDANPTYQTDTKGRKLLEYERLRADGQAISLLTEATFLRIVRA